MNGRSRKITCPYCDQYLKRCFARVRGDYKGRCDDHGWVWTER